MKKHQPVLLSESIGSLNLKQGDVVVDATFGYGGHSAAILEAIGSTGHLIAFDLSGAVIDEAKLKPEFANQPITFVNNNFRFLQTELPKLGIKTINAALFDLGVNSNQLDDANLGFSFQADGPLLMRLDGRSDDDVVTAKTIVNEWGGESIADILYGFADERFSRRIAKAIVEARDQAPITRTLELVKIIEESVPAPYRRGKTHCATKTFMALRMAVNDELGAIKEGIRAAYELLVPGGRLGVISFHSVEARIVKDLFNQLKTEGGELITKKVIKPTRSEEQVNRRARSAQLRIIEKHESNL